MCVGVGACAGVGRGCVGELALVCVRETWGVFLYICVFSRCVRFVLAKTIVGLCCIRDGAIESSVTSKKSSIVCKSCPKMISLENLMILTPLQKSPKNVRDLGKFIVATGFQKLPKVQ